MAKETYRYVVDVKDFQGSAGAGLNLTINSDFELTDSELSNKVMSLMVAEYDRLAHEMHDENASKALMNLSGVKDLAQIESNVVAIEHEVRYECNSEMF